ncbi:MAG: guanylate kinase [Lentisphaeria bacterium]
MTSVWTGCVVVLSGPSGAGKSTVCRQLLATQPLHFSVSCTTRPPRPGEQGGRDYHFLSRAAFEAAIAADEFLEHAEVHGNYYGTLRAEVEPHLERGADVLLDIDVQGMRQVRERATATLAGRRAVYVFLAPPSLAELERRLRTRATDPEEAIRRRLANARRELAAWAEYDFLVVNDQIEAAVAELAAIIRAARCRTAGLAWDPFAG